MSIDDKKIDELLKQVYVPVGLKTRLLSITESEVTDDSNAVETERSALILFRDRSWIIWVTALAAMLLIGFVMWPRNKAASDALISDITKPNDMSEREPKTADDSAIVIERWEAQLTEVKSLRLAVEINQLDHQISELSTNPSDIVIALSESDLNSLCIALAADSAIASGIDAKLMESDLQLAVDAFPDSLGAKLAQQILSNN